MDKLQLPPDFKEFLQLLNSARVEYLLVGGYAVGVYGYPRATGDMDIWVAANPENAKKLSQVLVNFGFSLTTIQTTTFETANQVVRMGVPPIAIDVITGATGVHFQGCYLRRQVTMIDGVDVPVIHLDDLRVNKRASGRPKDIDDLQNLPKKLS